MESNCIAHVLHGLKDSYYFHMKIVQIRHEICLVFIFLLKVDQSGLFECSNIFKKFILI
jgi:hypothetical protein